MAEAKFEIGELVEILREEWLGTVGIVTQPVDEHQEGHVLIYMDGSIVGLNAAMGDIKRAAESSTGFAQLGYHLVKLGSLVIEQKLIVYRT